MNAISHWVVFKWQRVNPQCVCVWECHWDIITLIVQKHLAFFPLPFVKSVLEFHSQFLVSWDLPWHSHWQGFSSHVYHTHSSHSDGNRNIQCSKVLVDKRWTRSWALLARSWVNIPDLSSLPAKSHLRIHGQEFKLGLRVWILELEVITTRLW